MNFDFKINRCFHRLVFIIIEEKIKITIINRLGFPNARITHTHG